MYLNFHIVNFLMGIVFISHHDKISGCCFSSVRSRIAQDIGFILYSFVLGPTLFLPFLFVENCSKWLTQLIMFQFSLYDNSLESPFIITLVLILIRFYCTRNILGLKENQMEWLTSGLVPQLVPTLFSVASYSSALLSPPTLPLFPFPSPPSLPPLLSPCSCYLLSAYYMPVPVLCRCYLHY